MSIESNPSSHDEAPDANLEFALSVPIVLAARNALTAHDRQLASAQERMSKPGDTLLDDTTLRTNRVVTSDRVSEASADLRYAMHTAVGALAHLNEALDTYYGRIREVSDEVSDDLIAINTGTAAPDDASEIS